MEHLYDMPGSKDVSLGLRSQGARIGAPSPYTSEEDQVMLIRWADVPAVIRALKMALEEGVKLEYIKA